MIVVLIRGLPGSGKSTLARSMRGTVVEADDFFQTPEGYRFDSSMLGEAHDICQARAHTVLREEGCVIVANTFSQKWEMAPYFDLARFYDATTLVIDRFDAGLSDEDLAARCVHGVPMERIAQMRTRWEQ